jgi:hypothetical protein
MNFLLRCRMGQVVIGHYRPGSRDTMLLVCCFLFIACIVTVMFLNHPLEEVMKGWVGHC